MADEEKLKLGKGAAFVKSRLKCLPLGDETWEADFQALPRPIDQRVTHYRGMVVTVEGGSLLSESEVHGRPSVNDLATLLAHARECGDCAARLEELRTQLERVAAAHAAFEEGHAAARERLLRALPLESLPAAWGNHRVACEA